jgi:hypothetical protein
MRRCAFVLILSLTAPQVWADLPLTVEELITDKGKIKLDLSLTYANADKQGLSTGEPIIVQTGPTSFVTLPTLIGESRGNSDTFVATLGLRYGLNAKAEVYARASALSSSQRSSGVSGTSSSSESRFADAWAGVNYQFKKEDTTPALLGFAEVALRERHRIDSASFKSATLGFTTYQAIDPVVLSLTAAYRFNRTRQCLVVDTIERVRDCLRCYILTFRSSKPFRPGRGATRQSQPPYPERALRRLASAAHPLPGATVRQRQRVRVRLCQDLAGPRHPAPVHLPKKPQDERPRRAL